MPGEAFTPTEGRLDVGDTWRLGVVVTDDETGEPVDADVTATVTLPDLTTVSPTVERVRLGVYVATHVITTVGRYTAEIGITGPVVSVVLFAVEAEDASAPPDVLAVRGYLKGAGDQFTDPDLQDVLDAELAAQSRVCRVGAVYPADLRTAALRRVQRALALRALPLAVLQGDPEAGNTFLPFRDPEIRRLEAAHRKMLVG